MAEEGKTSTFTIHHDCCDPSSWTPADVLAFAKFLQTGDMVQAAALSRLGMQLVLSEHHEPKGGELAPVGFAEPGSLEGTPDLQDIAGDEDVTPFVRLYSGPVEYAARYFIGDGWGNIDGREFEVFATESEAHAFIQSLEGEAA